MTAFLVILFGIITVAQLRRISEILIARSNAIMAQIDELNTALDELATTQAAQFDAVITEIQQAATANPGVDLTAAIARVQAMKDATAASLAALQADDTPAP